MQDIFCPIAAVFPYVLDFCFIAIANLPAKHSAITSVRIIMNLTVSRSLLF